MKKIAVILLFIFALVQAGPAIFSVCTNTVSFFMADEEKGDDKTDHIEKKDKKDYATFTTLSDIFSQRINTAIHLTEKIQPSPCLKKLILPPDFC